jgi:ribonuclease BN (tRNA processing enzyme)
MRITFVGSGDAFGSGGRFQACIHLRADGQSPALLDCGATSLVALKRQGLDPGEIGTVLVSHLHGDHFGGVPFLVLDGQFSRRVEPLVVAGPPGTRDRLATAMEAMYPGSTTARRRFEVEVVELEPGRGARVAGFDVTGWEVDHPSGAPPLALRVESGGTRLAYTGDTAWTEVLTDVADGADLLIAEAYMYDKQVPYHLSYADLAAHAGDLRAKQVLLTHMSAQMLAQTGQVEFDCAEDGLVLDAGQGWMTA